MLRPRPGGDGPERIVEIGRLLYEKSLIASTEGNLSVRLGGDRFLVTPAGLGKGRLRAADLVTVDASGRRIAGARRPSTEIRVHLAIYAVRSDVQAIVHAHPPTATGFAVAGVPLADCVLPEVITTVGSVPLVPYATPGESELAERILPVARDHDAFLMQNHGAVTLGSDLLQAFHRMEMIESFARILLTARSLGRVEPLAPEEVTKLLGMRPSPSGSADKCGSCTTCSLCSSAGGGKSMSQELSDPVVDEVLRRVESRLRDR